MASISALCRCSIASIRSAASRLICSMAALRCAIICLSNAGSSGSSSTPFDTDAGVPQAAVGRNTVQAPNTTDLSGQFDRTAAQQLHQLLAADGDRLLADRRKLKRGAFQPLVV